MSNNTYGGNDSNSSANKVQNSPPDSSSDDDDDNNYNVKDNTICNTTKINVQDAQVQSNNKDSQCSS